MDSAKKIEKEFGKLTTEQFQTTIKNLPEIKRGIKELPDLVRNVSNVKLKGILDGDFVWSEVYELPFEAVIG